MEKSAMAGVYEDVPRESWGRRPLLDKNRVARYWTKTEANKRLPLGTELIHCSKSGDYAGLARTFYVVGYIFSTKPASAINSPKDEDREAAHAVRWGGEILVGDKSKSQKDVDAAYAKLNAKSAKKLRPVALRVLHNPKSSWTRGKVAGPSDVTNHPPPPPSPPSVPPKAEKAKKAKTSAGSSSTVKQLDLGPALGRIADSFKVFGDIRELLKGILKTQEETTKTLGRMFEQANGSRNEVGLAEETPAIYEEILDDQPGVAGIVKDPVSTPSVGDGVEEDRVAEDRVERTPVSATAQQGKLPLGTSYNPML